MISEEVFRQNLDAALKQQGILKKERNEKIAVYLQLDDDMWDSILDTEEDKARHIVAGKKKEKHVPSEFYEQSTFVSWFKNKYPGVVIMSIRNGGKRTVSERIEQMMEGLHPGAADLYIPKWHTWIEFKRVKGGILSDKQKEFRDYVINECGDKWFLAEGHEQAIKAIESLNIAM